MNEDLYRNRICRQCGKRLSARYANEWVHAGCRKLWKRLYQRRYQKKIREETTRSVRECEDQ